MASKDVVANVKRSTLSHKEFAAKFVPWLHQQLPPGSRPRINSISTPEGTGMSSETILMDIGFLEADIERQISLVLRMAPTSDDVPIFQEYDLNAQYNMLQLVAAHSDLPVPVVRWLEEDASILGAPFFIMERVDGLVPRDVPPYVFAGWLLEASGEDRQRLQENTVTALAKLHAIDPVQSHADFLAYDTAGNTPLRRHFEKQKEYYRWVIGDGIEHKLLESILEWLENHWPIEEGDTVISWGDSRIANIIYQDFEVGALLDWEMAGLGPREIDIGWLVFMHSFYQSLTGPDTPGLPDFLQLNDVTRCYEKTSGHKPRDMEWYIIYAGFRYGAICARGYRRGVHFGEFEWSDDPDDAIYCRQLLQALLDSASRPVAK